jgi:transcriptional regulator with XRE-family HTH domain
MPKSLRSPKQNQLLKLLVATRKAKKFTQSEVAKRLGRTQSFVAKYEAGERRLDVIEFIDVARALGVDPSDLLRELLKR